LWTRAIHHLFRDKCVKQRNRSEKKKILENFEKTNLLTEPVLMRYNCRGKREKKKAKILKNPEKKNLEKK